MDTGRGGSVGPVLSLKRRQQKVAPKDGCMTYLRVSHDMDRNCVFKTLSGVEAIPLNANNALSNSKRAVYSSISLLPIHYLLTAVLGLKAPVRNFWFVPVLVTT